MPFGAYLTAVAPRPAFWCGRGFSEANPCIPYGTVEQSDDSYVGEVVFAHVLQIRAYSTAVLRGRRPQKGGEAKTIAKIAF